MMEKGLNMIPVGRQANGTHRQESMWICKVCGKEGRWHIIFLYLLHPPGGVSKSTIFSNHNLISVRHRKYRLIILLYLHVISCSSLLDLASSRDPEPRPSLESSNHSGLDLMLASIVESDLVFGYVSFSVSALNIQR